MKQNQHNQSMLKKQKMHLKLQKQI